MMEGIKESSNCIFQRILFPDPQVTGESGLYYRCQDEAVCCRQGVLEMPEGAYVDFHSYFNAFSSGKWARYTDVGHVSLFLDIEGEAQVRVFHNRYLSGKVVHTPIGTYDIPAGPRQLAEVPIGALEQAGDFSFGLLAAGGSVRLYGGHYGSRQAPVPRAISLAVCFTTYRREADIKKNLDALCALGDKRIYTYVADNGNTLDLPASDRYKVIPNRNTGGAGGFARNMMQVMDDARERGFTHFVLMDDDVVLDPRVLVRLMDFLGFVAGSYRESMVGGAMLRRDIPYSHVESGAVREGLTVKGNGLGLDLRREKHFMKADRMGRADYNAWWFCAIPVSYARPDNLPLPVFFQWDDIDYGIRNGGQVILMNGICTWHEPSDAKRTAVYFYYPARNSLIVDACHEGSCDVKRVLSFFGRWFLIEVCLYRYENARAMLRGMEDFLRGPDWLAGVDAQALHKEILAGNYQAEPMYDIDYNWYKICRKIKDCDRFHKFVRKFSFNGYLLPAKKRVILPCGDAHTVGGYRAAEILFYDESTGQGYVCPRDRRQAWECIRRYRCLRRRMRKEYRVVAEAYRRKYAYLTSREMWEKILYGK